MRELTVLGLIIGAALIISAVISSSVQVYFSPYQSCVRALRAYGDSDLAPNQVDKTQKTVNPYDAMLDDLRAEGRAKANQYVIGGCLNIVSGKNSN